ncbi:DNA polymerase III subunit beta [Allocoprobacillus halotolerans]|uniref:Beta sliding clamp n=1 Tax=Allocoprobacillus halotolerans TaxID=2944914 RepID=A0ABY5I6S3_9FIRM|nr:DNA polymerase III subunit beta [Allocoprobacillus halotolerans]UTY40413.1 DNA polymerase III subunit beta [Allocoprobacillus halotolerans]
MNFKIKRLELLNALTKVSRAVSIKSPLPVLTGIKFNLKDDELILTGSDSDITIQTSIHDNIEIMETGSVVLSSRYILEIIKKIDSEDVHIFIVDGTLTRIEGANSRFDLNGTSYIDYPRIDLNKTGVNLQMKSTDLKEAIEQTSFATSEKETRPVLTGVNFKAKNHVLECIATDSYRLAKRILNIDSDISFNIIIPKKSLIEISRIIEKDELIDLYVSDRKVLFVFDLVLIQTRLIDGTFPDTGRLIPDSFDYSMSIDSTSLLNSIDRASLLTNEQTNIVKLTMNQDSVILSSFSQEIGSVEENLSRAFFKGEPLKISFSARYLTDAIKSINGQKVRVLFTGEMKPFIIKDFEREDIIQLVLPVRTY